MTIQVQISAETEARLANEAAERSMDVSAYAASLLEQAIRPAKGASGPDFQNAQRRDAGRKSLVQLFAESPFKGLDLDFERDSDVGRDIAL